jgi:hypothetical protein
MTPLELKKMKVELLNVAAARAGQELRIEEQLDNIKRLEDMIKIQLSKEAELTEKIAVAEKEMKSQS